MVSSWKLILIRALGLVPLPSCHRLLLRVAWQVWHLLLGSLFSHNCPGIAERSKWFLLKQEKETKLLLYDLEKSSLAISG